MLAVLHHDQRLSDMADGNQISASTVRRWVQEILRLLAARARRRSDRYSATASALNSGE